MTERKYLMVYNPRLGKFKCISIRTQLIKQKLIGLLCLLIGILPILIDRNGTAALIFIPMGVYAILYKKADLFINKKRIW